MPSSPNHNINQLCLHVDDDSNFQNGQEQEMAPPNEFDLNFPSPRYFFPLDATWPLDDLNAFDENSPYSTQGYPQLFWRFDQDVSSALVDNADLGVAGKDVTEKPADSKTKSNSVTTSSPYAQSPFIYSFRAGPVIKIPKLIQFLQSQAIWKRLNFAFSSNEPPESTPSRIVEPVRDAIVAKIYTMLSKLIEKDTSRKIPHLFPPLKTIQHLLDTSRKTLCPFYQVVHPTAWVESSWDSDEPYADSGLFFTSLMALGCMLAPVEEARSFSVELAYLVRYNIVENAALDEAHLIDKWVITAWIMNVVYNAWSGNKRHMELAEAYQGTFSAFFLRRGYYDAIPPSSNQSLETNLASWSSWIDTERRRRFCQVWYILEQEISLFYCVTPSIDFTKIRCPMPVADAFFLAETEEEWEALVLEASEEGKSSTILRPLSLATFHVLFLRPDFLQLDISVTPLQLRLLLSAIQARITQYSLTHRWIPVEERFASSSDVYNDGNFLLLRQQEEFENMLLKWNTLASRVFEQHPNSDQELPCYLTAQMVWLEICICFDDIQMIAGKEGFETGRLYLPRLRHWVRNSMARKAIAHAGNVLELVMRSDSHVLRPIWWPLAVCRAALVLWCYSVGLFVDTDTTTGVAPASLARSVLVSLNVPGNLHDPIGRIVQQGEGMPCIQDSRGAFVPLHDIPGILDLCIRLLENPPGYNSPILGSMHQFLQDIKQCGVPYSPL
ncbi:uncharacterized protein PV06_09706 [Exophiala oligosperma]|uniref:Xylanolytic transcriptional activator regulatory domain-containing protein n=1 Tax=Exophiala oligosperma TaxID=215243 RepID=A0A0D2AEY0_9EURO|nr:uncharacterized protein PV06_09706 [Exophiala oligosperma]KIW38761.1 hypothetical protein PV06_09706 [Exophiala oligosperma]